jgi:anti-sigma factor RsiW
MSRSAEGSSCDAALELLEAFVDSDLEPDEERMVAEHLDGCRACRREHRVALDIRSSLRSLPEHDTPARVLWAVRMAAREEGSPGGPGSRLVRWILRPAPTFATAALVLAVTVTAVVWWQRPAPTPSFDDPEIARAAAETRFALALVGALGRRAALDEVLGRRVVAPTVTGVTDALRERLAPARAEDESTETEEKVDKGANE